MKKWKGRVFVIGIEIAALMKLFQQIKSVFSTNI